ncbi:MAG: hypothetical protein PHO57_10310 [Acidithiobacillus sp.]|nr:hypothetical protein [Acidithiobacillus sp.]
MSQAAVAQIGFGAVGWLVICSAGVDAFNVDLPVTRVGNDPDAWVEALLHFDFSSAVEQGDYLRRMVHRDWLLSGRVAEWSAGWLGRS